MDQLKVPGLIMLAILLIFFILGGIPGPEDIQWQDQTWTYTGRENGLKKYTSPSGSWFTIDVGWSSGRYGIGINGQKYPVVFQGQKITVVFPHGREQSGTILKDFGRVLSHPNDPISETDRPLFHLALEIDRVARPKGGLIILGFLITAYGVFQYLNPLKVARFETRHRAWMVRDPEPNEEYVELTQFVGVAILIGGWIFTLVNIW